MFLFPFSFFLPLLPPLSTEQHFPSPPPAPFPTAGAVEKGVGEGWGREDAGAGQRSSPAPGEGRGCTATAPLPHAPRRDTLRARGCQCRQPVSPASACARRVPSRNRAREKGLKEESLFNDTAGSGYKHQKLQKEDRQLHGRLHEDGTAQLAGSQFPTRDQTRATAVKTQNPNH
ncbi:splicing factor, arginine/serine-rich 19-like [Sagmatias obliquidens]|uniref:splicing factor, arginine/serine-rich 19-like n=1 Tax=Sagmatias obliquidens TaxID=3371155 RepID=UPI000F440575|nr:splicing factor, arginine/serine-rich 19-like [Lagenorhynchus obliquidens]